MPRKSHVSRHASLCKWCYLRKAQTAVFQRDTKTFLPSFYIFKEYSNIFLTHAMNAFKGSRSIAPPILNLDEGD